MFFLKSFIERFNLLNKVVDQNFSIDSFDFFNSFNYSSFPVPRPGLFISLVGKRKIIFVFFILYFSLPFIFLLNTLFYLNLFIFRGKISYVKGSDLFLYSDEISFFKVENIDSIYFNEKISFPNFYKTFYNRSLFLGSFFAYIPRILILKSFLLSNICILIFLLKNISNPKILQIYFCLEFSLFYEFKNHIDFPNLKNIYFTDHYCKYAIYFSSFKYPKSNQIQHGILSDRFFPKHLIFVNQCFVFDHLQKHIFINNLHLPGVRYINYKPIINFINLYENVFTIFFISRMDSFELEKELIRKVRFSFDENIVKIIIKPHPKMSNFKYFDSFYSDNSVHVVFDTFFYPQANIVISSNSTMKKEYEIFNFETYLFNDDYLLEVIFKKVNSYYGYL